MHIHKNQTQRDQCIRTFNILNKLIVNNKQNHHYFLLYSTFSDAILESLEDKGLAMTDKALTMVGTINRPLEEQHKTVDN